MPIYDFICLLDHKSIVRLMLDAFSNLSHNFLLKYKCSDFLGYLFYGLKIDCLTIIMMCSNSLCLKKFIHRDMSLQRCTFCFLSIYFLSIYFLSVGVAKRDVIRGIDADGSIPLQVEVILYSHAL